MDGVTWHGFSMMVFEVLLITERGGCLVFCGVRCDSVPLYIFPQVLG